MFFDNSVRNFGSVLCMAVLLFAGARTMAQEDQNSSKPATAVTAESSAAAVSGSDSAPLAPEKQPPASPNVTYTGELLKIDAFNSTLADILTKIATLTGANIDVPAGARGERMVEDLGPGPPRQILTSLLADTDFDFVIISSRDDPYSILTVVLTPRGNNNGSGRDTVLAERPAPNFRGLTQPQTMPFSENSAERQPQEDSPSTGSESASADATPADPAADASATSAASVPPTRDNAGPARVSDASSGQTPQQSMNQQLLQMYKQREQQVKDQRASAHPTNP